MFFFICRLKRIGEASSSAAIHSAEESKKIVSKKRARPNPIQPLEAIDPLHPAVLAAKSRRVTDFFENEADLSGR